MVFNEVPWIPGFAVRGMVAKGLVRKDLHDEILDDLYGDKYAVTNRAVDVQIVGLRKKLGAAGKYVETVRGVGYRFKE